MGNKISEDMANRDPGRFLWVLCLLCTNVLMCQCFGVAVIFFSGLTEESLDH